MSGDFATLVSEGSKVVTDEWLDYAPPPRYTHRAHLPLRLQPTRQERPPQSGLAPSRDIGLGGSRKRQPPGWLGGQPTAPGLTRQFTP